MTPLEAVARATRARQRAETAYRAAIDHAHQAGHTLREISEAAGITREGVRYLVSGDKYRKGRKP